MMITQMYAAILPDGRILEGGQTAASAVEAAKAAGVEGNIVVEDLGTLARTPTQNPRRRNPAKSLDEVLGLAGLPDSISKNDVFALTPEQAVERIRPLFAFLASEQKQSVMETNKKTGERERKTRAQLDRFGRAIFGPTGFFSSKNPGVWAKELMGRNAKLVKDTMNNRNPTSLDTRTSGDLLGLNLYPADKLATEFPATYGTAAEAKYENWVDAGRPDPDGDAFDAETMQVYGFNHPLSQIITSIQSGRGFPKVVRSLPQGENQTIIPVQIQTTPSGVGRYDAKAGVLTLTEQQVANLEEAFPKKFGFSTCSGASAFCKSTCLVYTGQNTSAFQNDWKKATCLFALVADPVAYLRLLIHALDEAGAEAAALGKPFFVRMNLLSDIPWEHMVPWLFNLYDNAPSAWYSNAPKRNPAERKQRTFSRSQKREMQRSWQQGGKRGFPVQFYDYTKVFGRDPLAVGVSNYDLTFSFSGTNAEECSIALYERGQRVAVVFAGVKIKKEGGRKVYQRALYTPTKKEEAEAQAEGGEVTSEQVAEDKTAKYGYGLPLETDMFARPQDKRRADKGMRKVVNADRHDARPLDPPNLLTQVPVISGLAWKSTGGGLTVTDKKKNAFVFRPEEMKEGEGWIVRAPVRRGEAVGQVALQFAGRGQKGRAEREARRLTALENIRQAGAFVTPTLLIESNNTFKIGNRKEIFADGVYVVAETPRETNVGEDGASTLPATA
ncbi:MAG: hypothetical protein EB084_09325 [Proteobacteria bacterium]|nr:hypothetical protein [Pseudomonadota bacterium]